MLSVARFNRKEVYVFSSVLSCIGGVLSVAYFHRNEMCAFSSMLS